MGETRVNLKHLLEDLRDSYPFPIEEAILTELVANSLDSKASEICFSIDPLRKALTVLDNGMGMGRKLLEEYHDIAATGKVKGKGIGFAGLGAKLALLISEFVLTETRSRSYGGATKWRLESPQRAPWHLVEPPGLLNTGPGTAVRIYLLPGEAADLLKPSYLQHVIVKHFYPLLDEQFSPVLKHLYERGIKFLISDQLLAQPSETGGQHKGFVVTLGRRGKPVGAGFLARSASDLEEDQRGFAVSTYGKVIKRGWDWIGLVPTRSPSRVYGLVEIPAFSEILTMNKVDFLKDANSLQKYYRYRKAVQEAIHPVLADLGETTPAGKEREDLVRPLEREIERVLKEILPEFPELESLLAKRKAAGPLKGVVNDPDSPPIGVAGEAAETITGTHGGNGAGAGVEAAPGPFSGDRIEASPEPALPGREHEGRRRRPGLMLLFEHDPSREQLGWLTANTVWINTAHKAYTRAERSGFENYHVVTTVAWVLSSFVGDQKSAQQFVNRFLSWWGSRR